ncbi:MAG: septum formation initiator family protein [Veillonella parvula]|nr:septum formation initiator family protein [Veillonella parvula]
MTQDIMDVQRPKRPRKRVRPNRQEKQHIEQQLQELQQRNEELEQEKARLQDPKTIEGVAREELGLVKPGEVPYVK